MSTFLIDVEGPNHDLVVKESLAKLEILKSQINNSQLMVGIIEEEVQKGIRNLRDNLFLSRQSHEADLIWIVGELKRVLLHWGDDETLNAASREIVRHLMTTLNEKVKEEL